MLKAKENIVQSRIHSEFKHHVDFIFLDIIKGFMDG